MDFNVWFGPLCEGLKILCPLVIGGYIGYRFGLHAKKPVVVLDYIKVEDNRTYAVLNNIGESPAINVEIGDCIFILQDKPGEIYNEQLKNKKVVFKFDRMKYIEAGKPIEVNVSATIEDKPLTKNGLYFYSFGLHRFENVDLVYKDNFGFSYRTKIEKLDIKK